MPRFLSRCRSGSESYPRSAITRSGFCRGRPFRRGTRTSASVASASVTSLGEALSSRLPAEDLDRRPEPSTSSPCPAWFYRPRGPFFCRSETAVQEGLVPLQQAFFIQRSQQRAPRLQPDAFVFPLLEPPPAGRRRRKLVRHESPRRAGLQNPQNALETTPVRCPGPASIVPPSPGQGQHGFHQLPLLIRQQLLPFLHDRSSSANPPHP